MNNKVFIAKCARGEINKPRTYGNLIFNGSDVVYSYGEHYPLMVKFGDTWIVNDRGYSVTTSKHISLARQYADYSACFLSARGSWGYNPTVSTKEKIIEAINEELQANNSRLAELSPRAFRQRADLQARNEKITKTKNYLLSL